MEDIEDIRVIIGKNIRNIRKQQNETLQSMSNKIGITRQRLSGIERGSSTSTNTLERIADVLGVNIITLYGVNEGDIIKKFIREISKNIFIKEDEIYSMLNSCFGSYFENANQDRKKLLTEIAKAIINETFNRISALAKNNYNYTDIEDKDN